MTGGPLASGDPGQLPPLPPLNPALIVARLEQGRYSILQQGKTLGEIWSQFSVRCCLSHVQ